MQRVSRGYTIVELMIVLIVTGTMLAATAAFLSSSIRNNRFSQSMRDTQSKIQDWLNDIPTGYANGTNTALKCMKAGSRPKFNGGGGSNKGDCIYLGKAIQFTDQTLPPTPDQDSKIYAYSVFGLRTYTPPGEDERPVANLDEASPVAAVNIPSYSGTVDLTEEYDIPGDTHVKSILKSSNVAGNKSHLAGFYLSFNKLVSTSSGSAGIRAYQYRLAANQPPGNKKTGPNNNIDECISMTSLGTTDCSMAAGPPGTTSDNWPEALSDWRICFMDAKDSTRTAIITISSSEGQNVAASLEFESC